MSTTEDALVQRARFSIWLIALIALVAAGAVWLAALRARDADHSGGVHDAGPAASLAAPALVRWGSGEAGLVWQPGSERGALAYTSLEDDASGSARTLLTNIAPLQWRAAPGAAAQLHLAWLEAGGRLRTALVDSQHKLLRGPIDIGAARPDSFALVPGPDGGTEILWIDAFSGELLAAPIDAAGRPFPTPAALRTGVSQFAAAADRRGRLWIAAVTAAPTGAPVVEVMMRQGDGTSPSLVARTPLGVPATALRGSLALGFDATTAYVAWTTAGSANPDRETAHVLALNLEVREDSAPQASVIQIPEWDPGDTQNAPRGSWLALRGNHGAADLHGLAFTAGQQDTALAVTSRWTPVGWQPVIVRFRDGVADAYWPIPAHLPHPPALALLALDTSRWTAAWTGLFRAQPRLFLAHGSENGLGASERASG